MVKDQQKKFGKFGKEQSDRQKLFMLNWTLTPSDSKTSVAFRTYTLVEDYAKDINGKIDRYGHARDFLFRPNFNGRIVNIVNGDFWNLEGDIVLRVCQEITENRIIDTKSDSFTLKSRAKNNYLMMSENFSVCTSDIEAGAHTRWLTKHVSGDVFMLQNLGTGLYLVPQETALGSMLEDSQSKHHHWHFESVEGDFHIVSAWRKREGYGEDRLDGHGGSVVLRKPNNGDFQIWIKEQ